MPCIRKTLITWLVITVVGVVTGLLVIGSLPSDMDPAQSAESKRTEIAVQRLTGVSSRIVIAVPSGTDNDAEVKVETLRSRLAALPGVRSVTTSGTVQPQAAPAFRSIDGRSTAIVVAISTEAHDDQIARIIAETRHASTDIFGSAVTIAGSAVVDEALGATAERDLLRADAIAVPIVLSLLALVLRTRRALLWGLASIIATIGGSLLLLGVVSLITDVSVFAVNVVTMFAIGLTVDYTLLIATEFHRQLAEHANEPDPVAAAISGALATAGRTVIYSGLTVGAALAGLLLFREPVLRSLGLGGIGATLTAVTVANTLLPALLRRSKPKTRSTETGASNPFRRLAHIVTTHPSLAIAGSVTVLAILAAPALRLTSAGLDVRALPPHHATRQAVESITTAFPTLTLPTTEILVQAPATNPSTIEFMQRLREQHGIATVESTSVARGETLVVVRAPAGIHHNLVETVRNEHGTLRLGVTGEAAEDRDFTSSLLGRLPFAVAVMASFTMLLLWLLTSSVLIPLKAVVVSLASLAASTGVLVWAFHDGHLASVLGFSRVGGLDPVIVVLAGIFAFGLSTDYEVFLLSAIERERRNGATTNEAIERGVGRTGRIITLAAALIIVVFIGFATGELIIIKQLGVALAAAILIDATIVRLVLVPATLALFAERNWWQPEPLRRLHNRIVGAAGVRVGGSAKRKVGRASAHVRSPRSVTTRKTGDTSNGTVCMELNDNELRDELVRRSAVDQEARNALKTFMTETGAMIGSTPEEREVLRELERVDAENTAWMQKVVSRSGWPTRSRVGQEAASAAWLLVQHADRNPEFQQACLDEMRALGNDEVEPALVAYLTDRVNLAQGLPQIYGTQVENHEGTWRPFTLEDPANVDERRAAVGLSTLAEYLSVFTTGQHVRPTSEH